MIIARIQAIVVIDDFSYEGLDNDTLSRRVRDNIKDIDGYLVLELEATNVTPTLFDSQSNRDQNPIRQSTWFQN